VCCRICCAVLTTRSRCTLCLFARCFQVLIVDDFAQTASLWESETARVVPEPTSTSGYALQITCAANATASCGAQDPKKKTCPTGCVPDGTGWCQAVATTVANRRPSVDFPLPTESKGSKPLSCDEYETFAVWWRISKDYAAPPLGSPMHVVDPPPPFPHTHTHTTSYWSPYLSRSSLKIRNLFYGNQIFRTVQHHHCCFLCTSTSGWPLLIALSHARPCPTGSQSECKRPTCQPSATSRSRSLGTK
jgi:hypothetical protein